MSVDITVLCFHVTCLLCFVTSEAALYLLANVLCIELKYLSTSVIPKFGLSVRSHSLLLYNCNLARRALQLVSGVGSKCPETKGE